MGSGVARGRRRRLLGKHWPCCPSEAELKAVRLEPSDLQGARPYKADAADQLARLIAYEDSAVDESTR